MNFLLRIFFSGIGLWVASESVQGIHRGSFVHLLGVAALLAVTNLTLGKLLKILSFIPIFLSLGCLSLIINGFVFYLVGAWAKEFGLTFTVDDLWSGCLGALVTSLVSSLLGFIFIRSKPTQRPEAEILPPE